MNRRQELHLLLVVGNGGGKFRAKHPSVTGEVSCFNRADCTVKINT